MIFHLNNGDKRFINVGSPTMGLAAVAVTFEFHDLKALLKREDLPEYLGVLSTRFVPPAAQRTWVGLTKEERHEISMANRPYVADAMAAHEEELKRRNT
jgi:hypothetical protein